MHIVQILLPISDNKGKPFPSSILKGVQTELASRFGGLTAYSRAPAQGIWTRPSSRALDDIVVVEVMVDAMERDWWHAFRHRTEHLLKQHKLVVRAFKIEML
jgi:hypothetical protein